MIGGNAVMKVIAQRISHPPLKFFHFTAIGFNHTKICSLKMKNSIVNVNAVKTATAAATLCRGDNRFTM
jgi:GTP:adenosylcobinamide-phosphate guanylyltransferase